MHCFLGGLLLLLSDIAPVADLRAEDAYAKPIGARTYFLRCDYDHKRKVLLVCMKMLNQYQYWLNSIVDYARVATTMLPNLLPLY